MAAISESASPKKIPLRGIAAYRGILPGAEELFYSLKEENETMELLRIYGLIRSLGVKSLKSLTWQCYKFILVSDLR